MKNSLYYGDNLDILRKYIKDGLPCNFVYAICTARHKSAESSLGSFFKQYQKLGDINHLQRLVVSLLL